MTVPTLSIVFITMIMALGYALLAKFIWNKQGSIYTKIHKNTELYKV